MSRAVRQQMLSMTGTLEKANRALKDAVIRQQINEKGILQLLSDCQETAIMMGTEIEDVYGEGTDSVARLEDYCESLYETTLVLKHPVKRREMQKVLGSHLKQIRRAISDEIEDRLEVVFLPYKASMWDSLESVWMAANEDEDCDAYVVPIPYYDKNPDGSFREMHYEIDEYPPYVPVTDYEEYDFSKRHPDIVFIHNPYDNYNYVTSIDPNYYSRELKKYTDMLVYIPYYSTTGGMSEAQRSCSAYYYADYVMIQAEKYRKYFDSSLPENKLQPFGSPKFDRIIRICNNPPKPPAEWEEKMTGKKVYFYNTSINGMLADTEAFLKKMKYVFECFEGRTDSCLLWRPHPLLESTLNSMRPQFWPVYESLKKLFFEYDLGIYDDTPDITNTIALCDAYIGDAATSVTSLFGIVGKPLFILDNQIHREPEEGDWRGKAIVWFDYFGNDSWMITQGNKLYHSPENDYRYQYFCDLCGYAAGGYYSQVITIGEKHYVCPANAKDIVVVGDSGIEKRIVLDRDTEQPGRFYTTLSWEQYLVVIPYHYPSIVVYDTETGKIRYLDVSLDVFIKNVDGEKRIGGRWIQDGYLYLASPADSQILVIDIRTGEERIVTLDISHSCGCMGLVSDGTDLWLLPYDGFVVTRWNPASGRIDEYNQYPADLECRQNMRGYVCSKFPFSTPAFCGDYVYLPAQWANMFVRLNKLTGEMIEWKPPMEIPETWDQGYFPSGIKGCFNLLPGLECEGIYHLFSVADRRLYRIDLKTEEYREEQVGFDKKELAEHEPGFMESSEWMQYVCEESAWNTLTDFLNGTITGQAFDQDRQLRSFSKIAANSDGTCGEKIYQFVRRRLMR